MVKLGCHRALATGTATRWRSRALATVTVYTKTLAKHRRNVNPTLRWFRFYRNTSGYGGWPTHSTAAPTPVTHRHNSGKSNYRPEISVLVPGREDQPIICLLPLWWGRLLAAIRDHVTTQPVTTLLPRQWTRCQCCLRLGQRLRRWPNINQPLA